MGERVDMLRNSLAALIASLLLVGASGAEAQSAIVDGSSNTILLPEIPVEEPEPPIEACELDPRGCQVDPCILDPASCEAPPAPEPPVAEPPAPSFSHAFEGSARLKGDGFKTIQPFTLLMSFDTAALTFQALDADGTLYGGHLVARGATGSRFKLFLDGDSRDAFAARVAARGSAAAGRAAGNVLGEGSTLTLKRSRDGSASLKIKSEVLVDGMGEVTFKANLSAAAPL
jgi:hypothetical protein